MVLSAFCGPDTLRQLLQKRLQELGLGLGGGVAVVAGRVLRAVKACCSEPQHSWRQLEAHEVGEGEG